MKIDDAMIQDLWCELSDIGFVEDKEKRLVLATDWHVPEILFYSKGTDLMDIWKWFDERHTKGVAWLVNEFDMYDCM